MTRYDLPDILYDAIKDNDGQVSIIEICKYIWDKYEEDLKNSGDLFFSWQYDIRWAATELRKSKRMRAAELSPRGIWEII
jgi:hypothetical protein